MGSLTSWFCDRCGAEVVMEQADTPPDRWTEIEREGAKGRITNTLCDNCTDDLFDFMENDAVPSRDE